MKNPTMTDDDINMLNCFWFWEGQDLEAWSGWEERKEVIRKERPEIVRAWEEYKMQERLLGILIKDLELSDEY